MDKTAQTSQTEQTVYEIDLLELWYRILDYWKVIFVVVVAGAALGFCISKFVMTPKYEATSKIYVLSSKDSVVNLSDLQLGTYLASDYQEVFATREVSEKVIANLGLDYTLDTIQKMMKVTNPNGTRILYITITSGNPDEAARISNEYSTVASDYIAEVMQTDRPTSLSIAVPPEKPSSPRTLVNTVIGGVAALVISVLVTAVVLMLDDKVKSGEDLTKTTGLPVFSQIPVTVFNNMEDVIKKEKEAEQKDIEEIGGGVDA